MTDHPNHPDLRRPAAAVRAAKDRTLTGAQQMMADASLTVEADGYVTHADGTIDGPGPAVQTGAAQ